MVGKRDAAQVFKGGRDGKGTIVEEGIKGATGLFQHPVQRHTDAVRFVQIELHRVQPFLFQAFNSSGVACAGEDLPATFVQHVRRRVADAAGTAGDEDAFFHDVLEGLLLRGRLYDGFAADSAFSGRAVLNLAGKCYCWLPSSFTYTKAGKVYVTSILSQ